MRILIALFLGLVAGPLAADYVVPLQTIRANTILGPEHVALRGGNAAGAVQDLDSVLGKESRVVLYAGRPIRREDVGEPALVTRNQLVQVSFSNTSLSISTVGRALDRGAEGDLIRVMNLASRKSLFGRVKADGSILITGP